MAPRGTDFGAWTGALRGRLTQPCFRPQGLAGRGRRPWGRGGRRAGRAPGNKQVPRRRPSRLAGQHAGQHADHPAAKPEGPSPGSRAQGRGETGGMTSSLARLPIRHRGGHAGHAAPVRGAIAPPVRSTAPGTSGRPGLDQRRSLRHPRPRCGPGPARSAARRSAARRLSGVSPPPPAGQSCTDADPAFDGGRGGGHMIQAARGTDAAPSLPDPSLVDTIERRHGRRIGATGLHRDPVRSSRGPCVKAGGLGSVTELSGAQVDHGGSKMGEAHPTAACLVASQGDASKVLEPGKQ
ncbi:hypothetical protein SAMN04487779_105112, partial [Belnapia rosea]